jgi:hypothetical protein
MIKKLKKLSVAALLVTVPMGLFATTGKGMAQGSSESISALTENPSFEKQVQRGLVGINLVRLSHTLLTQVPISSDAVWVDVATLSVSGERYKILMNSGVIQKDPYYSTVKLTALISGDQLGAAMALSPLAERMYYVTEVIFRNPYNPICKLQKDPKKREECLKQMRGYHIPDMNVLPSLSDMKTFYTFKTDDKVKIIPVTAAKGTLYKNIEEAMIALATDADQEAIKEAKSNYEEAIENVAKVKGRIAYLKAKLKDDKNANNPKKPQWEKELEQKKQELDNKEKIADKKQEILYNLLDKAALNIKNNFDKSKVPLAKKLKKMADLIEDLEFGAKSMFTSASAGLIRGFGALGNDLKVLTNAKARFPQKAKAFDERFARLTKGGFLLLPMIGVGTYYSFTDSSLLSHYEKLVDATIEGVEALEEAKKAKEAKQK